MNQLKWLLSLVTHNFGWKLLALASAFVIWVLVASEPELSTFATVPLEYRNLPDDLEISSAPEQTVTLELRGPAGELRGERRPAVVLDMSNVTPGPRTFPIADSEVSLARGVRLVRAIPSEVRFDFEPAKMRTIPVQVRFTGLAKGYVVAQKSISPDRLEIVGPGSHVDRMQAASTDLVDLSSVTGTAKFRVNAYLPDPYVRFEDSAQVTVTVAVSKE
jgi:YbbR domain-containing protein